MDFLKKYFFPASVLLALSWFIYLIIKLNREEIIHPNEYIRTILTALFFLITLLFLLIKTFGKEIRFTWILMILLTISTLYFNIYPSKIIDLLSAYQSLLILIAASLLLDSFKFDSTILKGAKFAILISALYAIFITLGEISNTFFYTVAYGFLATSLLLLFTGLLKKVFTSGK